MPKQVCLALYEQAFGQGKRRDGSACGVEYRRHRSWLLGNCRRANGYGHAGSNLFSINDIADAGVAIGGIAVIGKCNWLPVSDDAATHPMPAPKGEAKLALFSAPVAGDFDDILIGPAPKSKICCRNHTCQAEECRQSVGIVVYQGFDKIPII